MNANRTVGAAVALAALTAAAPAASARTWRIHEDGSGDAPTIQAAIDSSSTGDTLAVGPGTYTEDIDYLGKDILVESVPMLAATLMGTGTSSRGTVVTLVNGETQAATLRGFRIKGPYAAIGALDAGPTIEENVLEAFSSGGIYCDGPTDVLRRTRIKGNTIRATYGGPAILVAGNQAPEITGNLISENECGGILLTASAPGAVITGNTIVGNEAKFGGGVFASWRGDTGASNYTISWNVIAENFLGGCIPKDPTIGGSGMYLNGTGAWVHHNTFVGNRSFQQHETILMVNEAGLLFSQNIIALNEGDAALHCSNSDVQMRNNIVWEPAGSLGTSCEAFWTGNGNLEADPEFCDPGNGDYSLAQNSPAVTHEAGPLGAMPIPGCGPVAVTPTTWGRIKSMYGP